MTRLVLNCYQDCYWISNGSFPTKNEEKLLDILLYNNSKFNTKTNQIILMCTLEFITDLQRLNNPLFNVSLELFSFF